MACDYIAAFTSCSTETEPVLRPANLINEVKKENILLYFILNLAHKGLQIICEATYKENAVSFMANEWRI